MRVALLKDGVVLLALLRRDDQLWGLRGRRRAGRDGRAGRDRRAHLIEDGCGELRGDSDAAAFLINQEHGEREFAKRELAVLVDVRKIPGGGQRELTVKLKESVPDELEDILRQLRRDEEIKCGARCKEFLALASTQ